MVVKAVGERRKGRKIDAFTIRATGACLPMSRSRCRSRSLSVVHPMRECVIRDRSRWE